MHVRAFLYLISIALKNLRSCFFQHVAAVLSGTLMAFIVLASFGFLTHVKTALMSGGIENRISVYFKDSVTRPDQAWVDRVCDQSWIASCQALSRSQAKEAFREQNPALSDMLAYLEANPFPASLDVELKGDFKDAEVLSAWLKDVRKESSVDWIDSGGDWITRWMEILNVLDVLIWAIMLGLFLVAVLVVANTIRLIVYARRDEVEIQSLVGATEEMIQVPFLIEGLLLGLFSGSLAVGLVMLFFGKVSGALSVFFPYFNQHPLSISTMHAVAAIFGSTLMGVLGSLWAVRGILKSQGRGRALEIFRK